MTERNRYGSRVALTVLHPVRDFEIIAEIICQPTNA
jgi:hypothetical protein